ncbi:MAG: nucleotide exchange factor GrpE [Burkholderiales bacterium]|nr:nucleotide exchange factor GrpE [Burkholderiales bacterium]
MSEPDNREPQNAAPAEGPAAPEAGAEAKSLETLLAEAQARFDAQREQLLRALADADNARKRAQAEVAAAQKYAIERFAQSLLPVCDSLEAALAAPGEAAEALKSGVELTLKQLRSALEKAGVHEIAAAPGARFDPNVHQAMAAVEAEAEPNSIVAVMVKGYRLHDRVLRPALVTVAKAVEKPQETPICEPDPAAQP